MRSTRLMQQLLEGIRAAFPASHSGALQKIFRLGKPGETGEEFPPVSVAAAYDDQRDLGNSLLNPETPQLGDFQGVSKKALYLVAVKVQHQDALGEPAPKHMSRVPLALLV
ncbi:hypothetical protein SKAU_G00286610 [Synaphobranchus kaupii]|uniref:Uncharacterized protein n=1 Tax=Synaphobranchus kaupii TaxID=118154 RepID=A0A9Q1IPH3_SYNKA|nr:hypothetical protein SKAU_G00286610 [Synaphobranchus kaupii]